MGLEESDAVIDVFLQCARADPDYLKPLPRTAHDVRDWFHLKSPQALWGLRCAGVLSGVVGASLHRPPGPTPGGTESDWMELCRLAVLPSARSQGVGALLTAAVERHATTQNAGLVWLRCVHGSPAEAYYRRRGWRGLGPADFDPPFDVQQGMLLWRRTPGTEEIARAARSLDRDGWELVRLPPL